MADKGHIWKTSHEEFGDGGTEPAYIEGGSDDGFNSSGPCGGPMCRICGYWYCIHCHPEGPEEACEPEMVCDCCGHNPCRCVGGSDRFVHTMPGTW